MRNPERSWWQGSQVTSKIWQRCVVDLSADSADKTTRPHLLAPLFIIMPYESTAWAAARRVRITRRGAVGGTQPIRGGQLGPIGSEVTDFPRARTIRVRGPPPAWGTIHNIPPLL